MRFALAPGPTVASEALVHDLQTSSHEIEVCPQGGAIMEHMAGMINSYGGTALIVDYGQLGSNRFTLRVRKHYCTILCNLVNKEFIKNNGYSKFHFSC